MGKAAKTKGHVDPLFNVALNVLLYKEDGDWTALALEMDLRGVGATRDSALHDLQDLVCMQISFALSKGQPEMIYRPAEPSWFMLFAQVRERQLMMFSESVEPADDVQAGSIPLPPTHVINEIRKRGFQSADA